MSSTRHATDGEFHQERFCSSNGFGKGLMGNLVARRCEALSQPADRDLVWFLQLLSHRVGFDKVAAQLRQLYPERIGTASMHRFGIEAGQLYSAEQVESIRSEMPAACRNSFVLRGELSEAERRTAAAARAVYLQRCAEARKVIEHVDGGTAKHPERYSCDSFLNVCRQAAQSLSADLAELCVNPEREIAGGWPWYFPSLPKALLEYKERWTAQRRAELVPTQLSGEIFEQLDYALDAGGLVVLEGTPAKIGKTFACRTWCDMHPGRARFIEPIPSIDDATFYRGIARSIGSASALSFKSDQVRQRLELTLQASKLMLVFDEAQHFLPRSNRQERFPNRLNWLMAALVKRSVPVVLITGPQFMRDQQTLEAKAGWPAEEFFAQITGYKKLPKALSQNELTALVKAYLPGADSAAIEHLVFYANGTGRFLSAVEAAVKRARFLASNEGRSQIGAADIRRAIADYIGPSDKAMQAALAPGRRRAASPAAAPLQPEPCSQPAGSSGRGGMPAASDSEPFTRVRETRPSFSTP